jgi:hypothetical protein
MSNQASTKVDPMAEQRLVCLGGGCASGVWLVQRDAQLPDLWLMTHATGGSTWVVAAIEPICPRCGTTLHAPQELESSADRSAIFRAEPLPDQLHARDVTSLRRAVVSHE